MTAFLNLLWDYVRNGGDVRQKLETRDEYTEHEFHYDVIFEVDGQRVYVETRLEMNEQDIRDTTIHVVSVHEPYGS